MLQFEDTLQFEDNIKNEILNAKLKAQCKKIGEAFISKLIDLGYYLHMTGENDNSNSIHYSVLEFNYKRINDISLIIITNRFNERVFTINLNNKEVRCPERFNECYNRFFKQNRMNHEVATKIFKEINYDKL